MTHRPAWAARSQLEGDVTKGPRDVLVLVPGELKVIVANALLDKANHYGEKDPTRAALYTLAGQVDRIVAVGRNERDTVYDRIAESTGVPRDKVKAVIHAFQYSG